MTVNQAQLVAVIKAHIAKGDKAQDKAEQHYIAAGQHLKTLKAQHEGSWAEWEALLKERVGIGKSRASELMLIADGTKTVAQIRAEKAESARQVRLRDATEKTSPLRSGEIRMPEVSISPERKDGKIEITVVQEFDPLCPDAICSACGSNSWRKVFECEDAEEALSVIRMYTNPETYRELWDAHHIHHLAEGAAWELAQFLLDHPQYSEAEVAGWLECDEARIRDLRRWAKNGFDKREMPL